MHFCVWQKLYIYLSSGDLPVPQTCRRIGDRAFSVAAPRAWNTLPTQLNLLWSTTTFRRQLKTFSSSLSTDTGNRLVIVSWYALGLLAGEQYKYLSYSYCVADVVAKAPGNKLPSFSVPAYNPDLEFMLFIYMQIQRPSSEFVRLPSSFVAVIAVTASGWHYRTAKPSLPPPLPLPQQLLLLLRQRNLPVVRCRSHGTHPGAECSRVALPSWQITWRAPAVDRARTKYN